jgi:hypothetical protein
MGVLQRFLRRGAIACLVISLATTGCSRDTRAPGAPEGSEAGDPAAGNRVRPYVLARLDGVWWLVDPAGKPFFSLGVCVVNQGITRDQYDPAKPGYAAWRHHASPTAWSDAAVGRLRTWGFTTVGGWADDAASRGAASLGLALTPVLAAGMQAGVPWFDLWDPAVIARVEEIAGRKIGAARDHPRLVGYYTDNEMGWWNGALFKMTLEHPATSGQRQRLVKLLREEYRDDWQALLRDFDPEGPGSFADLDRAGVLYLRPGGGGIRAARRFLALAAERYYQLLAGIVHRHDPRGLILGDRYQSFYYPEVARAAAAHVDAVSTNLNAHWTDGTFARFYLDTLHELTGKPILVSEFYLTAAENRSGNPNNRGLFPVARTQRERAAGCRRTLQALLRLPYVVGADWFQYYDEPPGGRFDGENFNFGLVDIEDRPYAELVDVFREIDARALHTRPASPRPDASGGIPPAPADALGDFTPNLALREWDRKRGFVPPTSRFPLADLYLAWDAEALYLGLLTLDPIEDALYRDGRVPEEDRIEWSVGIDGLATPIRLRLGDGRPASGAPGGVAAVSLSGKEVSVRVVAGLRVPARHLGRERLAAGDMLRLQIGLTTYARAERFEWAGEFPLAR